MLRRELEHRKLNPCGRGWRHEYQIFIIFLDSFLVFAISLSCNIQLSFCSKKMKKRLLKEFQHIPSKRPLSVYQKGVSVLRIVCVSSWHVVGSCTTRAHRRRCPCKKCLSTLQFSTLGEALIANNNTNTWSMKVKKMNYEPDDKFSWPWYHI